MIRRFRSHLLALALYLVLTFVALDNLVLHLGTAIPGVGLGVDVWRDYGALYWNLWWVKHALFNLHVDPMFSNYVLYPQTINLSSHALTLTFGLLTAPLQSVLDLKLIFNGILVGSFIASGYLCFLFLRRHVRNDWLAALGGALFAFTPTTLQRAIAGHLNLIPLWWLPLAFLLWDGLIAERRPRWRLIWAAGLGLVFYLILMTDLNFVLWLVPLLAPYAIYTWLVECRGAERARVAGLALVVAAFALGPALIEPIPAILQARSIDFPRASLETTQFYSYQLRWLIARDPDRMGDSVGQLLPLLTILSVPLGRRGGKRWLWLGLGLGTFILALGPYLNDTGVPLPYLWVHEWMGGQYRTPVRFTTPATLALVMFVCLSVSDWLERKSAFLRWQPWLIGLALVGLVFDSGMLAPFPIMFVPDYRIYHEIGRDSEEYALLEVPVGPSSGYGEFRRGQHLQYYAYIHHKQIINGSVSRLPSNGLDIYELSPLLRWLAGRSTPPSLDAASRELAEKLDQWDMRYVLVHRDLMEAEQARGVIEFFNIQPELCLVDQQDALSAYRRIHSWSDCPRPELSAVSAKGMLNLGEAGDEPFIGPGWYDAENVGGPQARWAGEIATSTLRLVLPAQDLRVRFKAAAYPADQVVSVAINNHPLVSIKLGNDWAEYEFVVPGDVLPASGPSLITLTHARLESAFDRTGGSVLDRRPLAAAYDYFVFEPAR